MNTYESIRPQLRSGDLIATTHTGMRSFHDLLVWLVRVIGATEYAHVAVVWRILDRVFVIESVDPLVRIVPLSHFAEKGFYWLPTEDLMTEAELQCLLARVGKTKYSRWQAVLGKLRRLTIGADDATQCAEMVIECRSKSGVDLGQVATPSHVVKAAQAIQGIAVRFVKG